MYRYEDLPALMTMMTGDEKHASSATSTLDVLWTLYDQVLRVTPETVDDPDRDRFLLSKGHGPMALYAVLAARGFIPCEWLAEFGRFDSPLGQHPDRNLVPGVEIASGSLGHGLPIAVGVALALDVRSAAGARVFVLLGDAELDEGSNHEAIAFAGRVRLERLTAIVVDNASASHGWPSAEHGWLSGIERRFALEGWATTTVDGHDRAALAPALGIGSRGRPRAVVARTAPKEA